MAHKTTTHWRGGMLFESDNPSGNNVLMDTKQIAGTSGIDIVDILKKMKITEYNLKIVAEGELTGEHPKYYHTVAVDYFFSGPKLDKKKCCRAVQLSVDKYCGVMEMFRKFANVKTQTHFNSN